MKHSRFVDFGAKGACLVGVGILALAGCESSGAGGPAGSSQGQLEGDGGGTDMGGPLPDPNTSYEPPVTSVEEAQANVFIPPFLDCRDPLPGETGNGPNGQVCTHVSIAGCTEPGKYFADYASCDVVQTQRPFWPTEPDSVASDDDPRLKDEQFVEELDWVTEQVEACACVCCHDSRITGLPSGGWDISRGSIWTDTLSDRGLALFTGMADSSVLGAYPAEDNQGFSRDVTGIPTTDVERMLAFFEQEAERRGLDATDSEMVAPFGGPIYSSYVEETEACEPGIGVDPDGTIRWAQDRPLAARYVYVMRADADNPGVPPNLDKPEGTLWRLDVRPDAEPLQSGTLRYGATPDGTYQNLPESGRAPELVEGETYKLYVLYDVGLRITNCTFTFGG